MQDTNLNCGGSFVVGTDGSRMLVERTKESYEIESNPASGAAPSTEAAPETVSVEEQAPLRQKK